MRKRGKTLWDKTLDEIDNVRFLVSAFLLVRNGKVAGRITARMSKNRVLHVAFILYSSNEHEFPIYGYEAVHGCGYDLLNTGISDILNGCREILSTAYGINLCAIHSNVVNTWRNDFEASGFTVIDAL